MKLSNLRKAPRGDGFTLIELMVVILILAVLAALIVPKVIGKSDVAKKGAATTDEATLEGELQNFRLDCDRYPTSDEGLQALQTAPSDLQGKWKGPYLTKDIPNDPWGHAYVYQSPGVNGGSFSITSYGSDGQPGGDPSSPAADIIDTVN
jgi:general secretion pathway protein G